MQQWNYQSAYDELKQFSNPMAAPSFRHWYELEGESVYLWTLSSGSGELVPCIISPQLIHSNLILAV